MRTCGATFPGFPETCELQHGHESEWHHARRNPETNSYEVRWNEDERRELRIVELHTKHPIYRGTLKL